MRKLVEAADIGKGFGDIGKSVVTNHLTALYALKVEAGQCPSQEIARRALLHNRQHLSEGEPSGVNTTHVEPVVSDGSRAVLVPLTCDAVITLQKQISFLRSV